MINTADVVRIGRVSKINYDTGMIEATYPQYDNSVTPEFPVISFNDEYKMPKIGDEIAVLHLSNGAAAGVILGHYWNETNTPAETGEGLFLKQFALEAGKAYLRYKAGAMLMKSDNSITLDANTITFKCSAGTATVADIIAHMRTHNS